jgi:hypothetical protein
MKDLLKALDARLAAGARRVVLDNTYLTRASRRDVIAMAARHGIPVRGVWLDTPAADAQVNLIERILAAHGRLLDEEEIKRVKDPAVLPPMVSFRAVREVERPAADEGFATLETVAFVRRTAAELRPGWFVAAEALDTAAAALAARGGQSPPSLGGTLAGRSDSRDGGGPPEERAPTLVFAWKAGIGADELADLRARVEHVLPGAALAVCTHAGGPPRCWCRPPLPGLAIAFARTARVDPRQSVVVGAGAAHRTMATNLGAAYIDSRDDQTEA